MNISNKPLKKNIKKHRYQILCARRVSGITLISPWEQENQKRPKRDSQNTECWAGDTSGDY